MYYTMQSLIRELGICCILLKVKAKQIWLCLNCDVDVDGILCTLKVGGYMHWFVTAATSHILSEEAYVGD